MDSGQSVSNVLDYNIGPWCNYDDDTITKKSGYPKNVYDNLSKNNEKKREILLCMDHTGLCQWYTIKKKLLHPAPTHFLQKNQYPKRWKILRRE